MRSWLGAVAVAALVLIAPGVAVAGPDDPAQIQFKLPNRDAVEDFQSLGLSMDHGIFDAPGGGVLVSAWVTDEELALVRARGFEPVATIADKNQIDLIRAEREETLAGQRTAERALSVNAAGRRGASAAAGVVRLQRAEYYSNNVGRFLSIEAAAPSIVTCAPGC